MIKSQLRFDVYFIKGQIISKRFLVSLISSKKGTNEFNFTSVILVFVRFLEEIEDIKKQFRNYLTFSRRQINVNRRQVAFLENQSFL